MKHLEKNRKHKLRVLQKMLKERKVVANTLQEECYELERQEKQIAFEIASKLGVAPRSYVDALSIR